jgi:hypothetical protein
MKTKQGLSTIFIAFLMLFMMQCTKDNGSATVSLKASRLKLTQTNDVIALASGELSLSSALVQIENIKIENNEGDDNEDEVGDSNDNDDKDSIENEHGDQNEKDDEGDTKENEKDDDDQILVGPFSLDISSGLASIGDVTVEPGTYKKVNFYFVDGTTNGVNTIEITGQFKAADGTTTPFNLKYNSNEELQLTLADSGIVIVDGSTVSLSIVFDVNSWLAGLDFTTAEIADLKIEINATKNTALYNAFVAKIAENIDVED